MTSCSTKKSNLRRRAGAAPAVAALAGAVLLLGACGEWRDAVDPSDWYAFVTGQEPTPKAGEPVPGADQDYPRLGHAPEPPQDVSTREQIDALADSLAADRAHARYGDELARADDQTAPLGGTAAGALPGVVIDEEASLPPAALPLAEPVTSAQTVVASGATMPDETPSLVALSERDETESLPVSHGDEAGAGAVTSMTEVEEVVASVEPIGTPPSVPEPSSGEQDLLRDGEGELVGQVARASEAESVAHATTGAVQGVPALPRNESLAAIIRFAHGSTALGTAEREILAQVAAAQRERGGILRLVGHASLSGGELASADQSLVNFKISVDRAVAVADELVRLGVPRSAILVGAAADHVPAWSAADEAADRRVEVYLGT